MTAAAPEAGPAPSIAEARARRVAELEAQRRREREADAASSRRLGLRPDGTPRVETDVDLRRVAAASARVEAAAEAQGFRDGLAGRLDRRPFTEVPRFLLPAWERGRAKGLHARLLQGMAPPSRGDAAPHARWPLPDGSPMPEVPAALGAGQSAAGAFRRGAWDAFVPGAACPYADTPGEAALARAWAAGREVGAARRAVTVPTPAGGAAATPRYEVADTVVPAGYVPGPQGTSSDADQAGPADLTSDPRGGPRAGLAALRDDGGLDGRPGDAVERAPGCDPGGPRGARGAQPDRRPEAAPVGALPPASAVSA